MKRSAGIYILHVVYMMFLLTVLLGRTDSGHCNLLEGTEENLSCADARGYRCGVLKVTDEVSMDLVP